MQLLAGVSNSLLNFSECCSLPADTFVYFQGGASLVVDALNVLYTGINYGRAGYKFDDILRKALQKFANVMLIIRKGGDTSRIWSERDYFSDPRLSAFFCHRRFDLLITLVF